MILFWIAEILPSEEVFGVFLFYGQRTIAFI